MIAQDPRTSEIKVGAVRELGGVRSMLNSPRRLLHEASLLSTHSVEVSELSVRKKLYHYRKNIITATAKGNITNKPFEMRHKARQAGAWFHPRYLYSTWRRGSRCKNLISGIISSSCCKRRNKTQHLIDQEMAWIRHFCESVAGCPSCSPYA